METTIYNQITFYTQQIDSFEQFNANFVMAVMGFVSVLTAAIIAMMGARKSLSTSSEGNGIDRNSSRLNIVLNRAISMAFLTFPGTISLLMYVLAINCRRVAMYRGYLLHLEDLLHKGESIAPESALNVIMIEKYYGFPDLNGLGIRETLGKSFFSNTIGPIVLVVFIVVLLSVSLRIASHFAKQADESYSIFWGRENSKTIAALWNNWGKYKHYYYIISRAVTIISVLVCAICILDLLCNGLAMDSLRNALNQASGL